MNENETNFFLAFLLLDSHYYYEDLFGFFSLKADCDAQETRWKLKVSIFEGEKKTALEEVRIFRGRRR